MERAFRIYYPRGHMEIHIGTFFTESSVNQIKKVLKLAAQHCSNQQRTELINMINDETEKLNDGISELYDLKISYIKKASEVLGRHVSISTVSIENELKRRHKKIIKCRDLIEEVWKI